MQCFGSVYEWVGKVFEKLEPLFNMLEKIRDMLGKKAIIGAISGAAIAGPKGAIVGALGGGIIDLLTNFMGEAKQSFIDSGDIDARGRRINNSTANNKIDIYISGSDNPQETATTVKRELNKAMGSIGNSFDK
jgi:DNA replication initiation complex subunit (GINS family)